MARIVVIGGHGKVALQLARILTERGDAVSSVFRNPDHADYVAAIGSRPVVPDQSLPRPVAVAASKGCGNRLAMVVEVLPLVGWSREF